MRTGPVDHNVDSLKSLKTLLLEVIAAPKDFLVDSDLHDALKSQHMLAKYASSNRGISPSSLNTQKRLSESLFEDGNFGAKLFEDGYDGLNKLRCKAAEQLRAVAQLDKNSNIKKRSVAGLEEIIEDLQDKLLAARKDCWHLSTAFARAVSEATILAEDTHDAALAARWAESRRQLLSMVTLSSRGLYLTFPKVNENEKDK